MPTTRTFSTVFGPILTRSSVSGSSNTSALVDPSGYGDTGVSGHGTEPAGVAHDSNGNPIPGGASTTGRGSVTGTLNTIDKVIKGIQVFVGAARPAPTDGADTPPADGKMYDARTGAQTTAFTGNDLQAVALRVLLIASGVALLFAGALALRPSTGEAIADAIRSTKE